MSREKRTASKMRIFWRDYKKITPLVIKRGLPCDRKEHYLFPLLDALSGLIFTFEPLDSEVTWVAMLHFPTFHFNSGSGHAVQNQPEVNSELRLQPLHCSTISWQIPPLYEHPLFVMKGHSIPSFIVVQTNVTTSFINNKKLKKKPGN